MTKFYYRAAFQGEHDNNFFPVWHSEEARNKDSHIAVLSENSATPGTKRTPHLRVPTYKGHVAEAPHAVVR
jgi:hypothetical protein